MVLKNFKDVENLLARYIPAVRNITGKDITLKRMRLLMESLGNPQEKLNIIHVAGTSGKTSTCYYIAALLQAAGKKVGLTVSPHISSINERVQINLEPLPEVDFCQELMEFLELIKNVDPEPTYFELLIAFVYWYFAKTNVDYAVIETGLGGLHDATNMASQPGKVCAITDIGYDHTQILGKQLTEIAQQKAGIIHQGNQTFMHEQTSEVMKVFQAQAKKQGLSLNVLSDNLQNIGEAAIPSLKALPVFQQRNWRLAFYVYRYISSRDNLPNLSPELLSSSMAVKVPGRMDTRVIKGKTVILDGAHNDQKMAAFAKSFQAIYPDKKATIMLGLKEGKEYEAVLPVLKPICSQLIVTSFKTSQDLPIKSINPKILATSAKKLGIKNIYIETDSNAALERLLTNGSDICIVTGSFYLLSTVMPTILKM